MRPDNLYAKKREQIFNQDYLFQTIFIFLRITMKGTFKHILCLYHVGQMVSNTYKFVRFGKRSTKVAFYFGIFSIPTDETKSCTAIIGDVIETLQRLSMLGSRETNRQDQ